MNDETAGKEIDKDGISYDHYVLLHGRLYLLTVRLLSVRLDNGFRIVRSSPTCPDARTHSTI